MLALDGQEQRSHCRGDWQVSEGHRTTGWSTSMSGAPLKCLKDTQNPSTLEYLLPPELSSGIAFQLYSIFFDTHHWYKAEDILPQGWELPGSISWLGPRVSPAKLLNWKFTYAACLLVVPTQPAWLLQISSPLGLSHPHFALVLLTLQGEHLCSLLPSHMTETALLSPYYSVIFH